MLMNKGKELKEGEMLFKFKGDLIIGYKRRRVKLEMW
jgi:hypothetical protein